MILVFLLLLLVVPFVVLTLLGRVSSWKITASKRARVGLSIFFLFTGIGHFIRTQELAEMLPPAIPSRNLIIHVTGVLEILGAIGVWIPRLTRIAGVCLILMLILVLPANVYAAINRVEFGGHETGAVYLAVRIPFQLFVIFWTYFATEQKWFRRHGNI